VKVGFDANQMAINEICGSALAEATMLTAPQWQRDLWAVSKGINGVLQPAVPLISVTAGIGVAGGGAVGEAGATLPSSQLERAGSGLKGDVFHRSTSWVVDDPAAVRFAITGRDGVARDLYQLPGELNSQSGVFEWIVDTAGGTPVVTHQRFIPGGTVTGTPNQATR
jgi:hypothetical protein